MVAGFAFEVEAVGRAGDLADPCAVHFIAIVFESDPAIRRGSTERNREQAENGQEAKAFHIVGLSKCRRGGRT
jgi:hypothetical protein